MDDKLSRLPLKQRIQCYLELANAARRQAAAQSNGKSNHFLQLAEQWELLAKETMRTERPSEND